MAVSRWERGAQEPPSHGYIALGNLARDESCWYFWERAGLRSEHILRVLPTIGKSIRASELEHVEIVNAGSGLRSRPEKIQLVAVPLLNAVAGAHGEKGDDVHMLSKAPDREHDGGAKGLVSESFLHELFAGAGKFHGSADIEWIHCGD